ncbi:Mitochondrial ribosomal protein MRP51 [Penicillium paradoxum]|uniref:Mitochondrial ribosomal protein MRP51 n=1 Tax=Penicillium paradoxum TaxID=176176 RepID=UPI002548B8BD|nr:Mitochondrial ribosomal protein MRP51 [Penicillium paradoxum]KAJ5787755.1 Mitochondrial ribosomal protein MRP51 [Penicillium paradoxum]
MASARMSPTANLLRKSRLFALPQTLKAPSDPLTSRAAFESKTATLPHPIRASIVTPQSSLARGDWGLKRPLPAKSTSEKSSRPVVRVHALDTYEHVTDFESAADHTMTLEKFQEMHIPMSLPFKVNYATSVVPRHQSPFETHLDNTENSQGLQEPGAKQFRHTGPWLAGQTEAEFKAYLKQVTSNKPELMEKLREQFAAKRSAEIRKVAQDNGEDLEALPTTVTDAEFNYYVKTLRNDPFALGSVIFELLDLASPPAVPSERIGRKYYQPSGTKLSSAEYAVSGPPKTHPSAGLSYMRSHALIKNHPKYGPQAYQRPVEARVLRPKGRFKGRMARALAGIGGIAVEDLNSMTFVEQGTPPGLTFFDASIPGGGKYWVTPIRAAVDSNGRIGLSSYRASATAKAPYAIEDHTKPSTLTISDVATSPSQIVPRLDRQPFGQPRFQASKESRTPRRPTRGTEDVARSLLDNLNSRS